MKCSPNCQRPWGNLALSASYLKINIPFPAPPFFTKGIRQSRNNIQNICTHDFYFKCFSKRDKYTELGTFYFFAKLLKKESTYIIQIQKQKKLHILLSKKREDKSVSKVICAWWNDKITWPISCSSFSLIPYIQNEMDLHHQSKLHVDYRYWLFSTLLHIFFCIRTSKTLMRLNVLIVSYCSYFWRISASKCSSVIIFYETFFIVWTPTSHPFCL